MDAFRLDALHALRFLRQRPLFTLVAVASLAIGIGATTSIFSFANALLIRPPSGVQGVDRVVEVGRTNGGSGFDTFSYPELLDLRENTMPPFEALAGVRGQVVSYATGGVAEQVSAVAVSHSYFEVMGVTPAVGRFFRPDEDVTPGAHPVAVVSWQFWQERLGGAGDVVGRTIEINRHPFTVIGVAPRSFRGHVVALSQDVWVPITMYGIMSPGFDEFDQPGSSWLAIVGRLLPGATVEQARAAVALVMDRRAPPSADPRNVRGAAVESLGALPAPARPLLTAFFAMLGGLVTVVLLVTCANVAGMLLARGAAREREVAIRMALGSGRPRLIRQFVLEAVTLFLAGGFAGIALARWITGFLAAVELPVPVPLDLDARPDALVLAAGLGLALATGLAFGLAPALQGSRADVLGALKSDSRRRGSRTGRARRVFVVAQIALSLVLLMSAGLFVRALQRAADVDVGFDPTNARMVAFDLSMAGYDAETGPVFLEDLILRVRALPGVVAAGYADELPLDLGRRGSVIYREGAVERDDYLATDNATVSPGYFEAAGIRLVRGRTFMESDREGSLPVAIVSRTFAERAWPGEDPIGQRLRFGMLDTTPWTVIGVTADVKNSTLTEATEPMLWLPLLQRYGPEVRLVARFASDDPAGAAALRETIVAADRGIALSPVQSFEAYTSIGLLPQRLAAGLTGGLGMVALLLSALGIYGVIAFSVAQRTREIGVRMALGAHARNVVAIVVRDGLRLALPGLLAGAAAGLAAGFLIRGFILGVPPADPLVVLGAPLLLLASLVLACALPARRAARVEPSAALRTE